MVAISHSLTDPSVRPPFVTVVALYSAVTVFTFVNAARRRIHFTAAVLVLGGVIYRLSAPGRPFDAYWLLFTYAGAGCFGPLNSAIGGGHRTAVEYASSNRPDAEVVRFSLIAGFIIPPVCILYYGGSYATLAWQLFCVLVSFAHHRRRPSSLHPRSEHPIIRTLYILIFGISVACHIVYVWPLIFGQPTILKQMFLPQPLHSPLITSIDVMSRNFIRWDAAFVYSSTILVTLWFARSATHLVILLARHAAVTVILGPAAALTGVLIWREVKSNGKVLGGFRLAVFAVLEEAGLLGGNLVFVV